MAQWVKVPLVTIVTADCNKKVRNNGQCLSEAEKRKTKLQTHSVINSAPCERSFHERAAGGGHIEDRLNGPVIQKSLPKCNWLWLVPKKWHILAMALLPLCRRGRWTLDCWLKQNVLLPFEAQKNFRNRPGTHARVCALERGFFAAGSEVFLFARLDLGAMDRVPHSNGLNLEYSQRNTTRASTARGATSCKNNVAFCRMGLTQNSFVLQDSSSSASTNLLNFHDVTWNL